jgi:hypothetical protein
MPYLNCSRCGLSIRPRHRLLAIEHCPRCIARARVAVPMVESRLPARALAGPEYSPSRSEGRRERSPGRSSPGPTTSLALTRSVG